MLVVVGVLVALVPLAHASPPDQTWLGGLWDDGDHDDVVLLVTAGVKALGADVPSLLAPPTATTPAAPPSDEVRRSRSILAELGRAPPDRLADRPAS